MVSDHRNWYLLRSLPAVNLSRPVGLKEWLRGLDLNQRPSGYEPDELPGCSTPRSTLNLRAFQALEKPRIECSKRFVATLSPLFEGVFRQIPIGWHSWGI